MTDPDIVTAPTEDDTLSDELCFVLASMYQNGGGKLPLFLRSVETVPGFSTLLKREYVEEDDHGRFLLTDRGIVRGAYENLKGQLNVE